MSLKSVLYVILFLLESPTHKSTFNLRRPSTPLVVMHKMHKLKECKKREVKGKRIYMRKKNRIRVIWIMNRGKIRLREEYTLR